jgi:F-type H+-transporting ATPase subunit a
MRTHPFLLLALLVGFAAPAHAAGDKFDAVSHTADGNYWDFSPFPKIELPRIFLVRGADGALGLDIFGSTKSALLNGGYLATPDPAHGGGHEAEGEHAADSTAAHAPEEGEHAAVDVEALIASKNHLYAGLTPPDGGEIVVDFSITRHLVFIFIVIGLLMLLFLPMAGRYKRGVGRTSAPQGLLQNMLETLVIYVRDEIAKPNLGDKAGRFLPYLLTVFFFILFCNLIGLVPFGATATANISVTAVLAIFTFVITQVAGTRDYWGHIFNPPGVPGFVKPILVPVEILGLFTKPFALAIRLFANMTAGHLVILNLIGLIFIIGQDFGTGAGFGTSVPATLMVVFVYGLEVLVAFIQAYVFTVLSALFIGMATAEHEHDHDHSADHDLDAHDHALHASDPLVNGRLQAEHQRTVGTEAAMA